MSADRTSNNPNVQYQPSPKVTEKITPVETPKTSGKYSSGAPKDTGMTRTEKIGPTKIYRD
jgi:hypothetical protein